VECHGEDETGGGHGPGSAGRRGLRRLDIDNRPRQNLLSFQLFLPSFGQATEILNYLILNLLGQILKLGRQFLGAIHEHAQLLPISSSHGAAAEY
jgi:hypothetical protein